MTGFDPEDRNDEGRRMEALRDAQLRDSGWLAAGRADGPRSGREIDAYARTPESAPGRSPWTRPAPATGPDPVRDRETGTDDRRLAQLQYTEADQWRTEADVADDYSEQARVAAEKEPTAEGRAAGLATAEHEADVAAASNHEQSISYDSAERRSVMAADLESRGIGRDTVDNRVRADVGQARPAAEATRSAAPATSRPGGRGSGRTRTAARSTARNTGVRR